MPLAKLAYAFLILKKSRNVSFARADPVGTPESFAGRYPLPLGHHLAPEPETPIPSRSAQIKGNEPRQLDWRKVPAAWRLRTFCALGLPGNLSPANPSFGT
jgi:hypothetical protein